MQYLQWFSCKWSSNPKHNLQPCQYTMYAKFCPRNLAGCKRFAPKHTQTHPHNTPQLLWRRPKWKQEQRSCLTAPNTAPKQCREKKIIASVKGDTKVAQKGILGSTGAETARWKKLIVSDKSKIAQRKGVSQQLQRQCQKSTRKEADWQREQKQSVKRKESDRQRQSRCQSGTKRSCLSATALVPKRQEKKAAWQRWCWSNTRKKVACQR